MSNIKTSRLWGSKKKGSKGTPGVICGFCRQPIAQDKTHSGKFYSVSKMEGVPEEPGGAGVKIHTECWEAYQNHTAPKCHHCQEPVAHLPGRFSGKYYKCDDPAGQVHNECWEAFNLAKPPKEKCSQCGEPLCAAEGKFTGNYVQLDGGPKVHVECRSAYHEANTAKCLHCKAPVAPEKGRFSGEFYDLEGEGRVHAECFEDYEDATAEKCIVCGEGIRKKGRFCGEFAIFSEGRVHKECASEYQERKADKCLHCGKGVRKAGKFSGSYCPVERKNGQSGPGGEEGKVHLECWEAHETKLAADRTAAAAAAAT